MRFIRVYFFHGPAGRCLTAFPVSVRTAYRTGRAEVVALLYVFSRRGFRRTEELVTGIYLGHVSCCFRCFAPSCFSSWFLALRVWFARSQCRTRLVICSEWHTGLVSDRVRSSQLCHRSRHCIAQVLTIPVVFDRVVRFFTRSPGELAV